MTAGAPVPIRHSRHLRAPRDVEAPGRIDRWWTFLRWYLRELSGEGDYQRYLAEFARIGTSARPLGRRDFERRRMAAREGTVSNRCC